MPMLLISDRHLTVGLAGRPCYHLIPGVRRIPCPTTVFHVAGPEASSPNERVSGTGGQGVVGSNPAVPTACQGFHRSEHVRRIKFIDALQMKVLLDPFTRGQRVMAYGALIIVCPGPAGRDQA